MKKKKITKMNPEVLFQTINHSNIRHYFEILNYYVSLEKSSNHLDTVQFSVNSYLIIKCI